jgi:outer membrane protein insertion porin family
MTARRLALLVMSLVLLLPAVGSARSALLGQRILDIQVKGIEKVETEAILDNIKVRVGDILRTEATAQAIRDIYRLRYFQDVRVDAEPMEEGVILVVTVVEKPSIREVKLKGHKKITLEDIKEVLTVKAFSILDEAKVQASVTAIEDLYLEKGFFLAEIKVDYDPGATNEVTVTFDIREGKKVLVKRIDLVGNEALKEAYIKQRLQTKISGPIPGPDGQGTYRRDVLETDTEIISYLYSAFGYVEADVSRPEVFLSPDKRWIYVTIHIDEGPEYRVGTIDFRGDEDPELGLAAADLEELVKTVPGEVYNRVQIGEDVQRIVDAWSEHGYAFANVIPLPRQDRDRKIIDLVFDVSKGDIIHLEDVVITGNLATWDKVIRREVAIIEGDKFSGKAIEETRRRLMRLGYFEDVKITTPRGDLTNTLDLAIDVTEKPTGTFSLGAGFSSVESFVFTANVSRANFLGLGYTMALNANLSLGRNLVENGFFNGDNSQQNISVQFIDPYFLDSRWTAAISLFAVNRNTFVNEFSRGFNISFGHYLDKANDAQFSVRYSLEDRGLNALLPSQKERYGGQLYRSGTKSSLTASVIVDKRDDRIAATNGYYLTGSVEWAGGFRVSEDKTLNLLGGDFKFLKFQANARFFKSLGTPLVVLRYNLSFGWIYSLDGSIVPFTERYRSGGINSVRGFTPLSLGPRIRHLVNSDPNHSSRTSAVGGTMSLVQNVEIEFPIIPPAQVRGVVFFDAGNAFGGLYGNEPFRFEEIRLSAGFGVRWRSPMGPLRFEWGFPLSPKPGERGQVFEFTIGSFF